MLTHVVFSQQTYYTMTGVPNPVIVDIAAGELGVDLSGVNREVDIMGSENRSPVRRLPISTPCL
jgi:hypothetical protein